MDAVQRVAVVGSGGAGKSTFAAELGRRIGLPVVHLDQYFWKPNWTETPKEEWRQVQESLVAAETWIMDGNYGSTFDVRFRRADTVIVLVPSTCVCIAGALRRSLRHPGRAVQAADCPERLDTDFLKFLKWIWRYPVDSRPRLDAALALHADRLRVIELRSRREARAFLDSVGT